MNLKLLSRRLAIGLTIGFASFSAAKTAHADQLTLQHWATNQGTWPTYSYWLAGNFSGHPNKAKDLALVWADNNLINIDVHASNGVNAFNLYRGATNQGVYPQYVQWVVGDFNHDGNDDIADAWENNGLIEIDVHVRDANDTGFTLERYATDQGGWAGGTFVAGDFDADGWSDIALVWQDNGQINIDVHLNNREGGFVLQRWATAQGGWIDGAIPVAGEFDGNPGADIAYVWTQTYLSPECENVAAYCPTYVFADVHSSTKGSFAGPYRWSNGALEVSGGTGIYAVSPQAADMDGNGFDDIVVANPIAVSTSNLEIDIGSLLSNGGSFVSTNYASLQGGWPQYYAFRAGDFNGDGLADVADPFEDNGLIDIDVHAH